MTADGLVIIADSVERPSTPDISAQWQWSTGGPAVDCDIAAAPALVRLDLEGIAGWVLSRIADVSAAPLVLGVAAAARVAELVAAAGHVAGLVLLDPLAAPAAEDLSLAQHGWLTDYWRRAVVDDPARFDISPAPMFSSAHICELRRHIESPVLVLHTAGATGAVTMPAFAGCTTVAELLDPGDAGAVVAAIARWRG